MLFNKNNGLYEAKFTADTVSSGKYKITAEFIPRSYNYSSSKTSAIYNKDKADRSISCKPVYEANYKDLELKIEPTIKGGTATLNDVWKYEVIKDIVGTWVEQAGRFCPDLRVRAVTRTSAKRGTGFAEEAAQADVLVTSYTIARLDEDELVAINLSWLVLDEAQFIKNHASATYKAVRRLRAPSAVAITGTPLENSLMDLWSLLSVSAPGLLPGPDRFTQHYRRPIEWGDTDRLEALRAHMHPFLLRRTKEEVAADLPDKSEQVLAVELPPAHRRAYDARLARERQKVLGLLETDTAQEMCPLSWCLSLVSCWCGVMIF